MSDDLISRSALKEEFAKHEDRKGYLIGDWEEFIDNAPTVERPQGERAERALAIIDRLRTDGHINNKEQGALRRAILLPERPHGEWKCTFHSSFPQYEPDEYRCSICNGRGGKLDKFCKHCGAKMRKETENE